MTKSKKMKWLISSEWLKMFKINDGAETNKKIKLFTYSILIGLIVSTLFMFGFTNSPLSVFKDGINNTLSVEANLDRFVGKFALLALAGIAVAIGFKTGLFNIGVSGQMIAGGFTAFMIAIKLGNGVPNVIGQFIVIFIAVVMGAFTGAFAGALKAYFKIHEVVSTILINWIVWYFMRWMMDPNSSTLLNEYGTYSKEVGSHFLLRVNDLVILPVIFLLLITSFGTWFLLYKTSFGQQLKMVGQNKDASKYSGLNEKMLTVSSMGISGGVAGLLGVVYYFGLNPGFPSPKADAIPSEGFDGIAIALIAFSNPIAIIPVALFFGLIYSSVATTGIVDPSYISLALGVLMYISSINIIFSNLNIYIWTRKIIFGKEKTAKYNEYIEERTLIHEKYISYIDELDKNSKDYQKTKEKSINEYYKKLDKQKEDYVNSKKAVK